ncbi:MAG TPA: hypothetical protein VMY76_17015, partial [Gemmatimonadales bacterium]|nr:hypothetical protein [Gemmatimonadales bacterium]
TAPAASSPRARVLSVGGAPDTGDTLCRMIRGMGYEAHAAADAAEALRYLCEHPGEIRLLIADVPAPSLDAEQWAHRIRELDPTIVLVLTAGLEATRPGGLLERVRDLPVLEKPVTFEPLYQLLLERLGPAPSSSALDSNVPQSSARPRASGHVRSRDRERRS